MWIDNMDRLEGDTILDYLIRHQERADFLYAHRWSVGDVLMWDNIGTVFERDALDPDDHGVWNRAIAANLTNAYDMAVALSIRFDRREPARIVLTSSVAYRRGSADRVPYAAAKGGIVGLTRALSRKLAADVLVNAVAPGVIETKMADAIIANVARRTSGRFR